MTGQQIEPDHTVLRCHPTTPPSRCPACAKAGLRHDAVLRRLTHVPFGWKPTVLEVVAPHYRCRPCERVWLGTRTGDKYVTVIIDLTPTRK